MAKISGRVQLLHPEGKNALSISAENYELFEKAVMDVMTKAPSPITWTQIEKGVQDYLAKKKINFEGSPGWFAVSVKMHLEAMGVIESFTEKGKKLHRLIK